MTVYRVNMSEVRMVSVTPVGVRSITDRACRNEVVAWDKAGMIERVGDDECLWKRSSRVM